MTLRMVEQCRKGGENEQSVEVGSLEDGETGSVKARGTAEGRRKGDERRDATRRGKETETYHGATKLAAGDTGTKRVLGDGDLLIHDPVREVVLSRRRKS